MEDGAASVKFICLLFFLVIVSSCRTLPDQPPASIQKPLVTKDISSLSPLKVVRYETPPIRKVDQWMSKRANPIVHTLFLGPAFMTDAAIESSAKSEGESGGRMMQALMPDFSSLIANKFVIRVANEISNWPQMTVIEQPVGKAYSDSGALLEFSVGLGYGYVHDNSDAEFGSGTLARMKDSKGNIVWQRLYAYYSSDFRRSKKIQEFEADNGKLLKEEMEFAADKTVENFVDDLKKGLKQWDGQN